MLVPSSLSDMVRKPGQYLQRLVQIQLQVQERRLAAARRPRLVTAAGLLLLLLLLLLRPIRGEGAAPGGRGLLGLDLRPRPLLLAVLRRCEANKAAGQASPAEGQGHGQTPVLVQSCRVNADSAESNTRYAI